MKRITSHAWLAVVVLITVLFVLCNLLLVETGSAGVMCVRDLANPGEDDEPTGYTSIYGFPWKFLVVTTEGCFDDRRTQVDWQVEGLVADVVIFIALGVALYGGSRLYRRFRRRDRGDS
jgi:hypothetical protein